MKRGLLLLGGVVGLGVLVGCRSVPCPIPQGLSVEEQVDAIHGQLTLREKVSLTHGSGTMSVTAIPEKGILEPFEMSDGSCTVRPELSSWSFFHRFSMSEPSDMSTYFPSLSHLAQTWSVDTARAFGEAMGSEARARGKDMLLTPGINLARTPLCGRNWEYMGEDPHLTGEMAVQVVKGIQSQDVAACVKHFALNSQEWNRNEVDARPDAKTLRELYLPAFEKVVREGEVLAVMNAYNRVYGQYASHNTYLNNTILKGEWGFKGLLVTDWGSLHSTIEGALGGTDLEMNAGSAIEYFTEPLLDAVEEGDVPLGRVDDMVRRMLYVQARLHKFDGAPRTVGKQNAPEHQALAREIAAEGMVLLKNDDALLPLDAAALKRVVVVGQLAREKHASGGWSAEGKPPYEITPLAGLQAALPEAEILYFPFPRVNDGVEALPAAAITLANPDVHGEIGMRDMGWAWRQTRVAYPTELLGEGFMKAPELPEGTAPGTLTEWHTTFRAPESGNGFLVFTYTGTLRSVTFDMAEQSIVATGEETKTARLPVSFVEGFEHDITIQYFAGAEPSFRFGWVRPSEVGTSLQSLIAAAKHADAVLLFTGTRHGAGVAMECEGADRPNLQLLPRENLGIRALLHAVPEAIVVVNAGSPVEMPWHEQVKGLLLMSYAGQEAGNALADVLLGKRAPSGHLCMTWADALQRYGAHAREDYNEAVAYYKEGVRMGYRWSHFRSEWVTFPFGYGLTYTTFAYGKPVVTVAEDKVTVTFSVTNTGAREGSAVPQLYVGEAWQVAFDGARRDLRAFTKVKLLPGETKEVTLTLTPRDFAQWDEDFYGWRTPRQTYLIALCTSANDPEHTTFIDLPAWEDPLPRIP